MPNPPGRIPSLERCLRCRKGSPAELFTAAWAKFSIASLITGLIPDHQPQNLSLAGAKDRVISLALICKQSADRCDTLPIYAEALPGEGVHCPSHWTIQPHLVHPSVAAIVSFRHVDRLTFLLAVRTTRICQDPSLQVSRS